MAKYRLLNQTELDALKDKFVDYLILNGITGDDWEKMKSKNIDEANKILELFSDVVFEGSLRNIQFLDFVDESKILCFQCLEKKIVLIGIQAKGIIKIDPKDMEETEKRLNAYPDQFEIFTKDKMYSRERNTELFEMTEWGCGISDGQLFKKLSLLLSTPTNE